ncbi:MAG: AarF/UbiB family protein [Thermodesulfobacteriota bacterium]
MAQQDLDLGEVLGVVGRAAAVAGASLDLAAHLAGRVERLVRGVVADSQEVAEHSQALYRLAADRAAAIAGVVRATPRFARVTGELLRLAAAYRVHAARSELLSPEHTVREREALHRRAAERVYDLCVELRGGVLKVGQFASSRMDLLPQPWIEALSRLQDRVPPVPFAEIAPRVEQELGAPLGELFASFDEQPIAAASLAQVHGATLHDGSRVAVKVLVPGIEEKVEADLAALSLLASVLRDSFPQADLPSIADELARSVRAELDYVREAEQLRAVARNFADDARIVVPRLHEARCSGRVLTMERIDGEPIVAFLDRCETRGEDGARERDQVLATLLDAFCTQVLRHGLFQADPHPGNFLVTADSRLALLDFGSVQRLSDEVRLAYAEVARSVLIGDPRRTAGLLYDLGFRTRDGSTEPLVEVAGLVLELFRKEAGRLADFDPQANAAAFLAALEANPVLRVPGHFVLLGRLLLTAGGLLLRYQPRIDPFRVIVPHLAH